jgi:demethoxyubiquinone hydroxylase (CLK1/Coq7/Cat5 family)
VQHQFITTEAIEEKETISYEHQTTISELKRKYEKQLDKTLKDENDRLKVQLNKLNIDNAELRNNTTLNSHRHILYQTKTILPSVCSRFSHI